MTKEKIKEQITIWWVLDHWGIKVNRAGKFLCPFHNDHSPSCQVYPKTNSFYCFSCHEGGDIFKLVMGLENCSFAEAFQKLGGTYVDRRGKSRIQYLREVAAERSKASTKKEPPETEPDMSEAYEKGIETFPHGSPEWLSCRLWAAENRSSKRGNC